MKICAISDTHNLHKHLNLPEADILIHAGDFTGKGKLQECAAFLNWFGDQKQYKARILVAGNHDFLSQKDPNLFKSLIPSNVTYLQDSGIEFEGFKIWGTPWTPFFYDWAWNGLEERPIEGMSYEGGPGNGSKPDREHRSLREVYKQIPEDTEILVCHGPPRMGNLDLIDSGKRVGSYELFDRIVDLKELKVGVFGHLHSGYGMHTFNGIPFYVVANLNENYIPANPPTVIEVFK